MPEKPSREEMEQRLALMEKELQEKQQAVEKLTKNFDLKSKLVESSIDGIVGVDTKGKIFLFSRGAERLFGYSRQEIAGKKNIKHLYPSGLARDVNKKLKGPAYGDPGQLIN